LATIRVFSVDQFRAWRFPARAFVDFREHNHTFEDMFGLVYSDVRFTRANPTEELSGGLVSSSTFESLGIPVLFGRALVADDYKPGAGLPSRGDREAEALRRTPLGTSLAVFPVTDECARSLRTGPGHRPQIHAIG
jgi:hypothetical protein